MDVIDTHVHILHIIFFHSIIVSYIEKANKEKHNWNEEEKKQQHATPLTSGPFRAGIYDHRSSLQHSARNIDWKQTKKDEAKKNYFQIGAKIKLQNPNRKKCMWNKIKKTEKTEART